MLRLLLLLSVYGSGHGRRSTQSLQTPPPTKAQLDCPWGFWLEESEQWQPFKLLAGISRQWPATSEDSCVEACELDDACSMAIFDASLGFCGQTYVSEERLSAACGQMLAGLRGVPWEHFAVLPCKSGCVSVQKICNSCSDQTLQRVVTTAHCTSLFDASPARFCAGSKVTPLPGASGQDEHHNCCFWATQGECESNPFFMKVHCSSSCGTSNCSLKNARSCKAAVRPDCRPNHDDPGAVPAYIQPSLDSPQTARCPDRHSLCSFWAHQGECRTNPAFMRRNCRLSCKLC